MKSKKLAGGFTLVEILIVAAIIAIMASIVIASVSASRMKARDTRRESDIKQLHQAIGTYFASCYTYPTNLNGLLSDCNAAKLLSGMPMDPSTGAPYTYFKTATAPYRFHVCATVEKAANVKGKAGVASVGSGDTCDGTQALTYDLVGGAN